MYEQALILRWIGQNENAVHAAAAMDASRSGADDVEAGRRRRRRGIDEPEVTSVGRWSVITAQS
jgi:hypothetical protein